MYVKKSKKGVQNKKKENALIISLFMSNFAASVCILQPNV
jgi:hypothetical protein